MNDDASGEYTGVSFEMRFDYLGVSINFGPADVELNPFFAAACAHHLGPFEVAARLGRIEEDRSEELLIYCYAHGGVILGSPSEGLKDFKAEDWVAWLMTHRDEFRAIKKIAEVSGNFVRDNRGDADADATSS